MDLSYVQAICYFSILIDNVRAPILEINNATPNWNENMIHQIPKDPLDLSGCGVKMNCFMSPESCEPLNNCSIYFTTEIETDIYKVHSPDGRFVRQEKRQRLTFGWYAKTAWNFTQQSIEVGFGRNQSANLEYIFQCVVGLDSDTRSLSINDPFRVFALKDNQYVRSHISSIHFSSVGVQNDTLYCMLSFDPTFHRKLNASFYLSMISQDHGNMLQNSFRAPKKMGENPLEILSNDSVNVFRRDKNVFILPQQEAEETAENYVQNSTKNGTKFEGQLRIFVDRKRDAATRQIDAVILVVTLCVIVVNV